jgi:hypothetical protein
MSGDPQFQRPQPVPFDHCLRWWVWSRHIKGKKYLVQLDSYPIREEGRMNGECQCKSFACRLEPLLKAGITPAEAVARRLVKLKENQRPEDALRCPHILDALIAFAEADTRAVHEAEQAHSPANHKPE